MKLEADMMQKQGMDITSEDEKGAVSAGSDGAMKETQGVQGLAPGVGKQLQSNASTRRLSAESQDFEFNKLGDMVSPYNTRDQNQAGVLASADELFYKGQLLPLRYNAWSHHHLHSTSTNSTIAATSISSPTHELPFEPLSSNSQLISSEQDVRFSSSCRMDNLNLGLDSSLFDFRCSSFRSQSSKYSSYYCNYYANYGSACSSNSSRESSTTGGDSSSSSRDSNGSSQDSACSIYPDHAHMREHHLCCPCSCHGHLAHLPNGSHHCPKRKQGFIQSWRLLIYGLKRGSSHDHQVHHKSSKICNIQGDLKASPAELNHIHSSSLAGNQGSISITCGCKAQTCRRGYNSNAEKPRSSTGLKACEKEGIKTQLSADNQAGPFSEVKKGSKAPSTIINGASNHSGVSSKWHGYTKKIKPISMIKARLVGSNHAKEVSKGGTQSAARITEEEEGCSKRRVTRKLSLDRKFSQPSLCDSSEKGVSNLQVSFQFHAVSSSCPASVRSSPNHSGLLSPPPTTMSTMQELHSAVQGAIAHCKQSNSVHIVAHTPASS